MQNQHYIPRLILRGFCDDYRKSQTLYALDPDSGIWSKENVNNLCSRRDFYPKDVESHFAELERRAANALFKRVFRRKPITRNEQVDLARFLSIMLLADEDSRAFSEMSYVDAFNHVFDTYAERDGGVESFRQLLCTESDPLDPEILQMANERKAEPHYAVERMFLNAPRVYEELMHKWWIFAECALEHLSFITTERVIVDFRTVISTSRCPEGGSSVFETRELSVP